MKEVNLDNYLVDRDKVLTLGGKKLLFTPLSINRHFKAAKMYQDAMAYLDEIIEGLSDKEKLNKTLEQKADAALSKKLSNSMKFLGMLADACVYVVTPKTFIGRVKNFFKGNRITRKWIMKNCTNDQLQDFLTETIASIQKKTEMKSL